MKSFSDEIDNKKQSSIVPEHQRATQISGVEALRVRIAAIRDERARGSCERRFNNAHEQIELAERQYAKEERDFVNDRVKPAPDLTLTMLPDARTYDQRVTDAKDEFARSERGLALQETRDERREQLWPNLERFVDAYAPEPHKQTRDASLHAERPKVVFRRSVAR